ncbi:hypothetical protein VTL71DRAFT_13500 [Oculimacula yallundae]|uniref:Uncharacterized protein n=1 Tax=Oculimacula yallundae TaxID=86028 RepID=A0ABR4CN22_9HELO
MTFRNPLFSSPSPPGWLAGISCNGLKGEDPLQTREFGSSASANHNARVPFSIFLLELDLDLNLDLDPRCTLYSICNSLLIRHFQPSTTSQLAPESRPGYPTLSIPCPCELPPTTLTPAHKYDLGFLPTPNRPSFAIKQSLARTAFQLLSSFCQLPQPSFCSEAARLHYNPSLDRTFSLAENKVRSMQSWSPVSDSSIITTKTDFSMQSSPPRRDNSYISLGERRGKSDLARFSLDLTWAREASDSARSRAYPSPPMSGSPPLPPRRNPDSSDRVHGSYGSGGQDVYRGMPTPLEHMEHRGSMRGYMPEQVPSMSYPGAYRSDHMPAAPMQFQQSLPQLPQQQQHQHQQMHGFQSHSQQRSQPFSAPDRQPIRDAPEFQSPKQQRKTKGHVAYPLVCLARGLIFGAMVCIVSAMIPTLIAF